jgi:hypothetical protein
MLLAIETDPLSTMKNFRFSEVAGAPDTPGIYSWYYRIELTDKDIGNCVEEVELSASPTEREAIVRSFLENHLFRYYKEMPYMVDLSGPLKPRYKGTIDHSMDISASLVKRLAEEPNNLRELKQMLKLTVPMFASPIYIGVATSLRVRLLQHFQLINNLQHLKASAVGDGVTVPTGSDTEEDRDHKFAYEVSMTRGFRPSSLVVNTLELQVNDIIRYDLENILNRINYPLCGRN